MDQVFHAAYDGRLDEMIEMLVERLDAQPASPFRAARTAAFDISPVSVNSWLREMAAELAEQIDLRFIYVEMNGFSINPDRWFCDAFGFREALEVTSPLDDPEGEWFERLADYEAELPWQRALTLTGMEPMQRAFEWWYKEDEHDKQLDRSNELADWLVQCRFLALMRDAVAAGTLSPSVPVAAATHDSELVLRFDPPVT